MPSIKRNLAFDIISQLPEWTSIESAPSTEVFVSAPGFEERSISGFVQWGQNVPKGALAIFIRYPFNRDDNDRSEAVFLKSAQSLGVRVVWIDYNKITIGSAIKEVSSQLRGTVTIDISTMASFVFYPVLSSLLEKIRSEKIHIIYTEAADYFPLESEWIKFKEKTQGMERLEKARAFDENYFQSKGVESIYEPFGFEGCNPDNLTTSPIVIPNFSFERINRMIDYAKERYPDSSSEVTWLLGRPPNREKHGWRFDALVEMYNQPEQVRPVCTLNYKDIMIVLDEIWRDKVFKNSLLILTAGSKCQHLGTLLFHYMHPDIGIILSEPIKFTADRYSSYAGRQWMLKFDSELVSTLRRWNSLVFEW